MTPKRLIPALCATARCLAPTAPALAGNDTWTPLNGLTPAGAGTVRQYAQVGSTLYAATDGDGIFSSVNAGGLWTADSGGLVPSDGQPEADATTVDSIVSSGATAYAGTDVGVFSSTGGSWSPLDQGPDPDPAHPTKFNESVQALLAPAPGQLLAGTFGAGVYTSGNGGGAWTPPAAGNGMPSDETVWGLDSFVPGIVFAATSDGIYRSTDGGSTWTPSNDGLSGVTLRVFADTVNANIIYAETGDNGLFRSIDAGFTWSQVDGPIGQEIGSQTVRALQQAHGAGRTRLYAGTQDGVWAGTTDNSAAPGDVTWRQVTENGMAPTDVVWSLAPFSAATLLAGINSGGGYAITFNAPFNSGGLHLPTVSDTTPIVGQTLSAGVGIWSGTQTITYSYQWQRCTPACANITNATEPTYVVTSADQTHGLRLTVTAENDVPTFTTPSASSSITSNVGSNPNSMFAPGFSQHQTADIVDLGPGDGSDFSSILPQAGSVLEATGWLFNPAATSDTFQWYYCNDNQTTCTAIVGAQSQTYALSDHDVTKELAVTVTGVNADGSLTLGLSGNTNTIFPPQAAPVSGHGPTIAGLPYVGESLAGSVGQWNFPGTSFVRTWYQCEPDGTGCDTIEGATGPSYTPTADDVGHTIEMDVTADSNESGHFPDPVDVFSAPTAVIGYAPGSAGAIPPPPPLSLGLGLGLGNTDHTPPTLKSAKFASADVVKGHSLTLKYSVSEGSSLSVAFQRHTKGHKAGKVCKKGTKKHARSCTIVKTLGTVTLHGLSGAKTIKIPAKYGKHTLAPGTYFAVLTPIDAAGNRGKPKTLEFRVVRH
jgi:hypothetical protein